jgi:poly-gamma-glutamate synthesis protein (capsule biosynthesis protein)
VKRASILVVLALLGGAFVLALGGGLHGESPAAAVPAAASPAAPIAGVPGASEIPGSAAPGPVAASSPAPSPSPSPTPTVSATPSPTAGLADVPIVPVVQFRSALEGVLPADAAAALAGTSRRFSGLLLVRAEAPAILAALGLAQAPRTSLTLVADADALATALAANRGLLGFLRADAVGPAVRALRWGGSALFGVDRVASLAAWPLTARLPGAARPFDPSRLWTVAAAGDIMLDRGVYRETILRGRGVDFPFGGGRAAITGHRCCTSFGWPIPLTRRLGDAGAVREIVAGADLAFANHEGPAPVSARYHTSGTSFSFDQRLLVGMDRAGFDWVSLANNHIGDAGPKGVLETITALDRLGIGHGGAGRSATAARTPSLFAVGGVKVAVLGRDAIAARYWAGAATVGSAGLVRDQVVADIRAAKAAGADVVIVYPHWGVEYRATPTAGQRALAKAMIDAGADLIIGNHVHWAAAMEVYKGKPIWYGLGNFVFDQTWSEPTQQGLLLELTFSGRTLVQARIHPLEILDSSQPNLLDSAGGGTVVMGQVFGASKGLLPW